MIKTDLQKTAFNPNKLFYHLERVDSYMRGENIYPVTVEIDPSNICNLNCKWCSFGKYRGESRHIMSKEILMKLISDLADLGVKSIIYTGGGDPLIHPNIVEAIELAYSKGLDIGMATNGILLDEKIAEVIARTHKYCRISLDAGAEKTYIKIKQAKEGDFEKVIGALELLVKAKKKLKTRIDIGASFLICPENYREIAIAARKVKETGADFIQIKPVVVPLGGEQYPPSLFNNAKKYMGEAKRLENKKFKVFLIDYKFADITDKKGNYGRSYKTCWAHPFLSSVGADCNVWLCCHFRGIKEFSFGNLKKNSFKEIWNSQRRKNVINKINLKMCQPLCKGHTYNQILDFVKHPHPHKNIL